LEGSINDCSCDVDTVDHFNNMKIYPRLQSLLVKNFFRFYKVNLRQECPFWPDDSRCAMRFCQVENCEEQAIPQGIKDKGEHKEKAAFKVSFRVFPSLSSTLRLLSYSIFCQNHHYLPNHSMGLQVIYFYSNVCGSTRMNRIDNLQLSLHC